LRLAEVDVADNSGIIKIGLVAAAAYLAYKQGWLSSLGIGAPVAAATPLPVTPAPNPNAIVGTNTLAGIYARLVAKAPAGSMGVDAWNTYLAPLLPGGGPAPDPMPIFTAAVPGFSRSQPLTAGQYWQYMGPAIGTQYGLSGLNGRMHAYYRTGSAGLGGGGWVN
jgi:hypothetical protein